MAEKKKKLSDREIVSVLDQQLNRADPSVSFLADERKETTQFYNIELPAPPAKRSKYTSQEVRDAVDSTKAVILNATSQGMGTVGFAPNDDSDREEARIATAYCDHVLYKLNPGHRVLHDVLHNGLLYRNGVAKVWWEPKIEYEDVEIRGTEDSIALELDSSDGELLLPAEALFTHDPLTGHLTGILHKKVDKGQVRVSVLPPEEFLIDSDACSIEDAKFIAHRTYRLVSDLVSQGYDEDRLMQAVKKDDLEYSPERIARRNAVGEIYDGDDDESYGRGSVLVEECYITINLDGTGAKKWQITKVGDYILEKEVADTVLFVSFCPLPISHSFWGQNFAAALKHNQNATTSITRSIIDHTMLSSIPRWIINKGTVPNPAELTDPRFGGIVNVKDINGVSLLPQPNLNQYALTTLELIRSNQESNSGVSRTAMGLNHDVVGKQNSGALLDQVTSASQQKMTQIAKWFARFVGDLNLAIYDLAIRYERKEVIVEVAGAFVPVTPENWRERRHVTADISLNPEAKAAEAQKLVTAYAMFAQDPVLGQMFGPQQRRNMAALYVEKIGLGLSVDQIFMPVDQVPPPQPDPSFQLQAQLIQAQKEANMAQIQIAQMKLRASQQVAQLQAQVKALKAAQDNNVAQQKLELAMAEEERKSAELDHRIEMDEEELKLARDAQDISTIIKLTGGN